MNWVLTVTFEFQVNVAIAALLKKVFLAMEAARLGSPSDSILLVGIEPLENSCNVECKKVKCLKDMRGNVVVDEDNRKKIWKEYMEKLLNEENDWDQDTDWIARLRKDRHAESERMRLERRYRR